MRDYTTLRNECIAKAEAAENRAQVRYNAMLAVALRDVLERAAARGIKKIPTAEANLQAKEIVDERLKIDPVHKAASSEAEWYVKKAIMYGVAALGVYAEVNYRG